MEAFFELITNPVVLFILIGFISSLFNKAKENAKDPQRQRPERPMGQPAAKPVHSPQQPHRTSRNPVRQEAEAALNDIQKVYLERKKQAEQIPVEKRVSENGRRTERSRLRAEQHPVGNQEASFGFQPDRDRLVEGLIWSEVLGEPRSKRPHHRSRRN